MGKANGGFDAARRRLEPLLARPRDRDETLRQVVAILHDEIPHFTWVGIYLVDGEALTLHNFIGRPTPHARIPIGEGICGAAIAADDTIVVDDVHSDPRYLACSVETASEIVVPIRSAGRPVGEIDIDSDRPRAFGAEDRRLLEEIAGRLSHVFA